MSLWEVLRKKSKILLENVNLNVSLIISLEVNLVSHKPDEGYPKREAA